MRWKKIAASLAGGLAGLLLATIPASAQCTIKYSHSAITPSFVGPFISFLDLNAEGITERSADVVISGVGCFTAGSTLEVEFNAIMSVPTAANFSAGQGTYWNFHDPSGAMTLTSVNVVNVLGSSGNVSKVQIAINSGTLDAGAEVLLKNLRFDVAGETIAGSSIPTPYAQVADTANLNAAVDTTNPPTALAPFPVGHVLKTVASAGVTTIGWGFEDGICPFLVCPFPNKGGSGPGNLLRQATWNMVTNPAWTLDFPFRFVGEGYTTTPNVLDPNFIGQTDLVVDVEDIPAGVTVTFPQHLYICGARGVTLDTWTASNSTGPQTGGALSTIYKTTQTTGTQGTLNVTTGDVPSTTGCPFPNTIGVIVGNPSGNNTDGNQQADLRVVMGPGTASEFTGDDVSATAIPRYVANITASAPTRLIIGDPELGNPVPYFYLNPTQTVLLYPYVTNLAGWDTGIEVGNTGNDRSVFGNTGQNGQLDFYFFPSGGTPFVHTVTTADQTASGGSIRGLTSPLGGSLAPGGDFAATLSGLLSAAGHVGAFDGYVIVVAHFNFGHGTSLFFTNSGNTSTPALILGGHCSYNFNNAQQLITGAPSFPACSSARQGDITRLPERLEN